MQLPFISLTDTNKEVKFIEIKNRDVFTYLGYLDLSYIVLIRSRIKSGIG